MKGCGRSCANCLWLSRKLILVLIAIPVLYVIYWRKTFFRDLKYYVRPLWGHPARAGPPIIIPHVYALSISAEERCAYHNWTARPENDKPLVYDAFTFSVELDLLEIRLKELWPVVDYFLIVEATRTFQGQLKPLTFQLNRNRFKWAEEKITHFVVTSLTDKPVALFDNESRMRGEITRLVGSLRPPTGSLIIASDLDEIPSRAALELIKSCQGYPKEVHFSVNEYLYSFEFPTGTTNWRPHVTLYDPWNYWYHHIILKGTKFVLADAGWHCSFCFRFLTDFQFKMRSYSHSELGRGREDFFEGEALQRRICEGKDVFELPPEAYTLKEFVGRWGRIKRRWSTKGVPEEVVRNREKYGFLLMGGCLREDFNGTIS